MSENMQTDTTVDNKMDEGLEDLATWSSKMPKKSVPPAPKEVEPKPQEAPDDKDGQEHPADPTEKTDTPEEPKESDPLFFQKKHWREKANKAEEAKLAAEQAATAEKARADALEALLKGQPPTKDPEATPPNPQDSFADLEKDLSAKYTDWEFWTEPEREAIRIARRAEIRQENLHREQEAIRQRSAQSQQLVDAAQAHGLTIEELTTFINSDPKYKNADPVVVAELLENRKDAESVVRPGIENQSGTGKVPNPTDGLSLDDAANLMELDPLKFTTALSKGKLKIRK